MKSKLAIIAFIISIISSLNILNWFVKDSPILSSKIFMPISGIIFGFGGLIGIVLSWIALYYIKKEKLDGRLLAIISLVLSIINLIALPVILAIAMGGSFT